jgi:DNA-binding transcriptional LysR family regulator
MSQLDVYVRTSFKPRHLQLLVALDEIRHLGKVAASINVSQPAVSKALGELERGLGLKLFERTARGVVPTAYGECLIRHARVMLSELAQARDELRGLATGSSGSVRVGVLATAALELLPRALAVLKSRQPGISVLVREGTVETLLPELWLGNLDLIVGRLPDGRSAQGLGEKTLMEEGVSVVVGRHHPLVRRKRLHWSDLRSFPWVLPPVNTLLREPLERVFEIHGIAIPANRIETLSVHVIRAYLHYTNAIAALATDVSSYYEALGLLAVLPLELPRLVRPVGVVWSRHRPLAPAAQTLIQCLEESARPGKRLASTPAGSIAMARVKSEGLVPGDAKRPAALKSSEVKQKPNALGAEPHPGTPEETRARVTKEIKRRGAVIERAKVSRG